MRASYLLLAAACLLVACDRDRAFHGKWIFDRAYTETRSAQTPGSKAEEKSFLGGMKAGLVKMLVPSLLDKLEGAELSVGEKEMIFTTKDGTGKSETFAVVERPTPQSWRIKKANGDIETYTREGDYLSCPATGDLHFPIYFKKAGG